MSRPRVLKWANASQITDRLWVGGDLETRDPDLAATQLDELDRAGIASIVDVRLEWSDEELVRAAKPGLRYLWLGVDDAGQKMPDDWFETGTARINGEGSAGSVLVHCHMGINRGPSLGFAALLTQGWDPIDALDRIRVRRPIAYIAYAEDALDWWLRQRGERSASRIAGQRRVRRWRAENQLDLASVIRKVRRRAGV